MNENTLKAKEFFEKELFPLKIGISYKCNYEIPILFSDQKEKVNSFKFSFWVGNYEVTPVLVCELGSQSVYFTKQEFVIDILDRNCIKNNLKEIVSQDMYDIKLLKNFLKEIEYGVHNK